MKKFNIPVPVTSVDGVQTFQVKAESAEEALEMIKNEMFEGEIIDTEIYVDSLGFKDVHISDIWEQED